ncbi:hypothetical protein GE118_01060 [Mycoplasma sp. NEAQ87857]|uniref:DUF5378 family protein n=1 Tax=Mycoplasma sp. NEAQ87857 TaxID=2683967 RepID=UPI00131636D1|nr:DUF5378 family protein [Mycoplasma sp. NEAQ87857]QGZ97382.1 hypothetical protein GE118_01060 [Mycoplasma sp. NEAQ87857]
MQVFIFVFITFISILIGSLLIKFFPKINNRYTQIAWSLIFLIYFIIFRYSIDIKELITIYQDNNPSLNARYSGIMSRIFFLDWCPAFALLISFAYLFDNKGRVIYIFSIMSIVGGYITLPTIPLSETIDHITLKYLFIGTDVNRLYFLMHWYLAVSGTISFIFYTKPKYSDVIYAHITAALYFIYVAFISLSLDVLHNVTGIRESDWRPGGEYENVIPILKVDFPYVIIVGFGMAYIFINSSLLIKAALHKHKKHIYHYFKNIKKSS